LQASPPEVLTLRLVKRTFHLLFRADISCATDNAVPDHYRRPPNCDRVSTQAASGAARKSQRLSNQLSDRSKYAYVESSVRESEDSQQAGCFAYRLYPGQRVGCTCVGGAKSKEPAGLAGKPSAAAG